MDLYDNKEDVAIKRLQMFEPEEYPHAYDDCIDNLFIYHPPKGDQVERYRILLRDTARLIILQCPMGIERDASIEALRQTIMWANASIACGE